MSDTVIIHTINWSDEQKALIDEMNEGGEYSIVWDAGPLEFIMTDDVNANIEYVEDAK